MGTRCAFIHMVVICAFIHIVLEIKGDVTIVSDVQWRHLDSFWKANASHVDLYNIVLEGRTLHLYLPDAEEIARVRALFSHFKDPNTLPTYSKATTDLENFELVIENEPLDPDTCDVRLEEA